MRRSWLHRTRRAAAATMLTTVAVAGRWWSRSRHSVLDVLGLGLLATAAGMLAVPAGVAAAGVACLLISLKTDLMRGGAAQ